LAALLCNFLTLHYNGFKLCFATAIGATVYMIVYSLQWNNILYKVKLVYLQVRNNGWSCTRELFEVSLRMN